VTDQERIAALESSSDHLRAALLLAGREIKKLNFGKTDNPVLKMLRRTLREARGVRYPAKAAGHA